MKSHLCRLEFGVSCLADIRLLIKAWDRILALEAPGNQPVRHSSCYRR